MSYFCQNCRKYLGGHGLRFRDKASGKYPDLKKKLVRVIQHDGAFYSKISKASQRRQTILVIFCRRDSVA